MEREVRAREKLRVVRVRVSRRGSIKISFCQGLMGTFSVSDIIKTKQLYYRNEGKCKLIHYSI